MQRGRTSPRFPLLYYNLSPPACQAEKAAISADDVRKCPPLALLPASSLWAREGTKASSVRKREREKEGPTCFRPRPPPTTTQKKTVDVALAERLIASFVPLKVSFSPPTVGFQGKFRTTCFAYFFFRPTVLCREPHPDLKFCKSVKKMRCIPPSSSLIRGSKIFFFSRRLLNMEI